MFRRIVSLLLCLLLLAGAACAEGPALTIDGEGVDMTDVFGNQLSVYVFGSHYYVPLDKLLDALGLAYAYDEASNTIAIRTGEAPADAAVHEPEQTLLKAEAPGFAGDPVKVTVALTDDGAIASLTVDASSQMAGIGKACENEKFTSQFIGKKGPFSQSDIDVCSGATFTSMAVIDAVNCLFPDEKPAGTEQKAEAPGFAGDPVKVTVALNDDGAIASLTVDASSQLAGIGKACENEKFTSQFIGKKGPFSQSDIDVCSGATHTSLAVIDAVNKLFPAK